MIFFLQVAKAIAYVFFIVADDLCFKAYLQILNDIQLLHACAHIVSDKGDNIVQYVCISNKWLFLDPA